MIRLVTLDLDNTLWDVNPVLVRAEKQLQQWIQEQIPEATPYYNRENLLTLRQQFVAERPEIANLPTTLRKAVLEACFSQAGLTGDPLLEQVDNAFEVFITLRNEIDFFPETIALLETLKPDYQVIALSNGNACVYRVGLGDYFDAHFSAESVGKPKPHPAMFQAALEHARVKPEQAVHIGDHPKEDIEAAQKLGYRTIWFNQNGSVTNNSCNPDREVNQLNQVVSALNELMD